MGLNLMPADGKLTWVNSLIYNTRKQLAGGHSDDTAFTVSMEYGWGLLSPQSKRLDRQSSLVVSF